MQAPKGDRTAMNFCASEAIYLEFLEKLPAWRTKVVTLAASPRAAPRGGPPSGRAALHARCAAVFTRFTCNDSCSIRAPSTSACSLQSQLLPPAQSGHM